jgi:uncharacterized membrane protein (UPF0127 family)
MKGVLSITSGWRKALVISREVGNRAGEEAVLANIKSLDELPTVVTPPLGPGSTPTPTTVTIGDASFAVELAVTPQQQAQGLSGRPSLTPGTGMLFIFGSGDLHSLWMKDMRFPLDIVWISAEYAVVDITEDVPPPDPGQTTADLPTYMPAEPAQYVLVINAGQAESADIRVGDMVKFGGFHLIE